MGRKSIDIILALSDLDSNVVFEKSLSTLRRLILHFSLVLYAWIGCMVAPYRTALIRIPELLRSRAPCYAIPIRKTSILHPIRPSLPALSSFHRIYSTGRNDLKDNPTPPNTSSSSNILQSLSPYSALARLDKPTGTLLLFLPCTWSLTLAAHSLHLPPSILAYNTILFGAGAFIMRGAGCTINDLWDRKLDAQVERTKMRPLAAGTVTPFQAITFLGLQLSAGLAILLQLNWYSIALGASSLGLVVIYPFMKRITYWPQLVLGLAFNWGALLGWSAMASSLVDASSILIPLYLSSICWTIVYDTIYAHQDKNDDISAGIKSTALLFGDYTKPVLYGFSLGMLAFYQLAVRSLNSDFMLVNWSANNFGELIHTGHPFFSISLSLAAIHLVWQITTVDLNSREDCWSKFRSNIGLGVILWAGLLLDYYFQVVQNDATPSQPLYKYLPLN